MNRKLIACLLSIAMLCSLLPTFALATSAEDKQEQTTCETCGKVEAECTCTPETCTTCNQPIADCTCDKTEDTCDKCDDPECDGQHENWCTTCKADNCEKNHCDKCGIVDCTSKHENWCELCKKDDCGKTHVFCETCQVYDCGNAEHAINPADEGGEGDGGSGDGGTGGAPEDDPDQPLSFYETLIEADSFQTLFALMTGTDNSGKMSELTYEQLTNVKERIDPLYESLAKKDADTESNRKLLHGQIETLIAQNDDAFAAKIDSCTCSANKSHLVVHATDCPAYIELPAASVTEIGTSVTGGYEYTTKVESFTMDLTYAMQFATQESYTDLQKAYYGTWVADFVITTNMPITGADAYLAGQYDIFNDFHNDTEKRWVKISISPDAELKAGEPLQLIPTVTGMTFPFLGVVEYIPTFKCGLWVSENYLQRNPRFALSVELRLYPSTNGETYDPNNYVTLTKINYQPQSAAINYVAGANGTVDKQQEAVGTLVLPTGATPTANKDYHFAGWFTDREYKNAVDSAWVDSETGKLTPGTNANGTYDSATYYAKFDPDIIEVTVNVTGNSTGDNTETQTGETYLFCLSGKTHDGKTVSFQFIAKAGEECVIVGLPDGDYTIAPVSGWNGIGGTSAGVENGSATVGAPSGSNSDSIWCGYAYASNTITIS